ncbi:CYTH domain-containing protein [Patescibacteria group bacterium]|nr:CYTH domain-containing protein [Patescibacteria group bacterium]
MAKGTTQDYEIEIKSLLGTAEAADKLRTDLKKIDPTSTRISSYTQINHYFEGGNPHTLATHLAPHLAPEHAEKMHQIAKEGKNISVRSREMNREVRMVMKASIGDDSSANGVMRMEIEAPVIEFTTLEQLDAVVLGADYTYQAKWSRTREEYRVKDVTVCLDKNAGYGYLAEFEKVIDDATQAEEAKKELVSLMEMLNVSELPQDRLERMFSFYNEHWPEYYGTEKIFIVE